MALTSSLTLEETRPRLVDGVEYIPFNPQVTFLKNTVTGDFLKLSAHEASLARYFNGKYTLAEILLKHVETRGTSHLLNIAEILLSLKTSGFIADETGEQGPESEVLHSGIFGALKAFKSFVSMDLHRFKNGFGNRIFRTIAGFFSSTVGLSALILGSLLYVTMTPGFRILFIDFGGFSGSGFAAKFTIGYYLSFLAILWVSVCLILSVKNLLSAYALAAKGCTVFHPRLRSVCGFVYFDCTITDVVSAGPALVVKVFGIRMFLPILILQATTALEPYIPGGLLIPATIKKACFLIAAFSIMPLAKTDLNNMLYLLTRSTRDFYQSLSYLGKRYVFRTENLPEQPKGANDFSIVIALLSFVWLAGMGSFLWSAAQAGFMYLAESFAGGISLETAYIPLQLATMLVPFVILVVMAVSVGASNVQYILRAPVHQLVALSEKMQKAPASGHILSFLRHLPLFSALNDDQLARLCERFNIVNYRPGRNIILQGTAGDSFFIIVSGKCRVVIEDMAGVRRVVSVLSTGDCFGEIALIDKVPRTATVIAASAVSLLRLGRRDFEEFLTALPTERKRITDTIRRGKILMSIPLFSYLSPDQISFLIDRCSAETFKKDEVVFRQGDAGDKFYIIQEGLVTITRVEDNKPVLVKTLARGSVFGEIALVKHLPRTAQAAAASDLTVLSVGKECFYELIGKNLLTGAEIDRLADRRMAEIGKGSAVVT